MARTSIEWTATQNPDGSWSPGYTFNPWVGCTKLSQACDNCYADAWATRTGQPGLWKGQRRRTTAAYWTQPLKWDREAARMGVRRRVFCASLADVFDNQVPTEWRDDLWQLIRRTPNLDWLLLTKRPQNIAKMLPEDWAGGYANVWLGTTTETRPRLTGASRICSRYLQSFTSCPANHCSGRWIYGGTSAASVG